MWWSRRRASCHPRFFGFNYDPGARKEARGATQRQKRQAGIARYQGGERPREAREARRPGLTATSPTFFTDVGGSLLTQRRTDGASLGGRHAIGPSREALGRPVDCAWQSTANEAGATTWMELGESRATGNASMPLGVQGMAAGQASSLWDQRTPRTGPEGSSPLYRGPATAEEGPGRAGRV